MQPGSIVAPIIVAIGVIAAAVAFAIVTTLLNTADSAAELRLTRLEEQAGADRAERLQLVEQLKETGAELRQLRDEMSLLANRAPEAAPSAMAAPALIGEGEDFENPAATEALTEEMRLAKARFNSGVTQPRNSTMLELLGPPRASFSTDCQAVTSDRLIELMETRTVGTITVTMLKPALDSLARVLDRLRETDPDIYEKVGTAGALCARFVRGSVTAISNHSWGTAIDLTLEGELDRFADGGTQFGLLILAEYFNDEGWYWGAAYNREDSMHFEVGEETLRAWLVEGSL